MPASAEAKLSLREGNDPAAVLFDPLTVNNISLWMSNSDFESLKYPNVSQDNEGDWRRTTMRLTIAGKPYGPYTVGVHLKGAWGSWRDVTGKAAFKVKMNAFVKGQTLLGLTKLTLNNMVQDPSYIHEFMTYKFMRSVGLPVPRTGYTNVSLNGINYGLHLNVETVDKKMLARWAITSKRIYKGSLPNFPDMYPDNQWAFTLESGTADQREDLANFLNINNLSGEDWWAEISTATNMELLTTQWAAEYYASHWDGYIMNRNNYYLNFDDDGKALMLSWGVDQTWGGAPDYFTASTLLPNKCWSSNSCKQLYLESMAKVAAVAQNLNLSYSASAVANAIEQAIIADPWGNRGQAWDYQQAAINLENYRKIELNQIVVPWDTTAEVVRVGNKKYQISKTIYLTVGATDTKISLLPRQMDASSSEISTNLSPGSNLVNLQVTSADGQYTKEYALEFYVLRTKTSSVTVNFVPGATPLTKAGNSNYLALLSKLDQAKSVELVITTAKESALINNRIAAIQSELKRKGVGTYKLSIKRTGSVSNKITMTAKYQF